jgi:hypothetical protein
MPPTRSPNLSQPLGLSGALSLATTIAGRDDRRRSDPATSQRQPGEGRAVALVVEIERSLRQGVPQLGAAIIETRPAWPRFDDSTALGAHGHDVNSARAVAAEANRLPAVVAGFLARELERLATLRRALRSAAIQQTHLIARTDRQRIR